MSERTSKWPSTLCVDPTVFLHNVERIHEWRAFFLWNQARCCQTSRKKPDLRQHVGLDSICPRGWLLGQQRFGDKDYYTDYSLKKRYSGVQLYCVFGLRLADRLRKKWSEAWKGRARMKSSNEVHNKTMHSSFLTNFMSSETSLSSDIRCVLFNSCLCDGRTDGHTHPFKEMRDATSVKALLGFYSYVT